MTIPICSRLTVLFFLCSAAISSLTPSSPTIADDLELKTMRQLPVHEVPNRFHRIPSAETWNPNEVALIICDVWDSHHCVNAVRRVQELAPRIDALAKSLRYQGATIIHAPSDCMPFYESHPARARAKAVPTAGSLPSDLNSWCDRIPSEESAAYPIDQSEGGEDDDLVEHAQWAQTLAGEGRNPKLPWRQQIPTIDIQANRDFISDSGNEVWNILEANKIKHVVICGVHTNMCVLGRPFGLRQLANHGKHVVLIRDLTDTMYDPLKWPYVNHFSGTDLVIDHVERYVCSTLTSDQLFGLADLRSNPKLATPFRFSKDRRPHLAILMAEDEYQTATTLPSFAATYLQSHMRVSFIFGDSQDKSKVPGIEAIDDADSLLVSVRRRPMKKTDLDRVRKFVASGRPIVGIRTASHAFCLRNGKPVDGLEQWPEYDAYTHGGSYTNHYANDLVATIRDRNTSNPVFISKGSLYQVSPLKSGTRVLWNGKVEGQAEEPVAWTFVRADGGSSFYTSLGHPTDFDEPAFCLLLANAIRGACNLEPITAPQLALQSDRYSKGHGKQR
jgi:nicotinamidase-related amidase/type 1 glutamine amidotransferase